MKVFDKLYLRLFTKSADNIISDDGYFEFKIPPGFRFRKSKDGYQVFKPGDQTFLFQWSGQVFPDEPKFNFNIETELNRIRKIEPHAFIQLAGILYSICSTFTTKSGELLYTWKTGDKNKRLLITLLLSNQDQEAISKNVTFAQTLLTHFTIKHIAQD